jgi:hypothetical protein
MPTDENKSLCLVFVRKYFVVKVQTLFHNREAKNVEKLNLEKTIEKVKVLLFKMIIYGRTSSN